ncbi:MAG: TadE/TadG family protein [Rhizobiaceae bacterium]|nr:TadE/TadG family protein [Rhizobiaceae bacterium]
MKKLASFLKSTSGNVAITTALLMFPLMTGIAATVDFSNYVSQRSKVQNATDAAALAAAKELETAPNSTEESLKTYATNFFNSNVGQEIDPNNYTLNLSLIPGNPDPSAPANEQQDRVNVTVDFKYDTIFYGILSRESIEGEIKSFVTLGNRTVEVALVLDNSGSMSGSRISTLRTEAKNLVDIVHNSASLSTLVDPVQFSIVPFSGTVNIGTNNRNESWLDQRGYADPHHENFDWDTYRTNNSTRYQESGGVRYGFQESVNGSWQWKTRWDVFDMVGTQWGGCVEMRPWPHNVLDTSANAIQSYSGVRNSMDADNDGQNDGHNALFVPYFAPDEPNYFYAREEDDDVTNFGFAPDVEHRIDDDSYRNDYLYDFQDYNPSNPNQRIQLYTNDNSGNPAFGRRNSDRQIERTNFMFKYQRNIQLNGSLNSSHGPNDGCRTRPITELSTSRDDIKNEIGRMQASGTTNIQQGLTWGWRTLSERAPFTGGRPIDELKNLKFIVLLTDGNNFYSTDGDSTPNQTAYGAWGYARVEGQQNLRNPLTNTHTSNRWIEGLESADLADTIYTAGTFDLTPESNNDFEKIMNAHTNQACVNIKNDGVSIYAVAFAVPQTGGVRQLLQACAGSGIRPDGSPVVADGTFYFDVDQGGLAAAFEDIARQITNLRLSG